jgi:C4-dicarboxylate-specific signal transduction histidine kinase
MGEMASGIAHEVNQPLTAICSYTQAAINLMKAEDYNPANLTEILYKTKQQSLRAGQIIHRMREFIKSNPKQRSTVEINTLVREASNLCEDEIKQNNVKLAFGLEENIPPVNADHIQIEQVLINLIRNSIEVLQHLPKNQPRQLSIQTQLIDNSIIQVRVKDNGPGIDEEQKLKVLTPFYTTKNTGMGMGLSICRSLIEAHDGVLFFNSEVGKGSTFYFELPLNYEKN